MLIIVSQTHSSYCGCSNLSSFFLTYILKLSFFFFFLPVFHFPTKIRLVSPFWKQPLSNWSFDTMVNFR